MYRHSCKICGEDVEDKGESAAILCSRMVDRRLVVPKGCKRKMLLDRRLAKGPKN